MDKKVEKKVTGVYISLNEIVVMEVTLGDVPGTVIVDHIKKIATGFSVKEQQKQQLHRPMALNSSFFSEEAGWVSKFKQTINQIEWLGTKNTVVTLSSQFSIFRYFLMPAIEKKFWAKAIPLEAKKYIPLSFDDISCDYDVREAHEEGKIGVLFSMTHKSTVDFLKTVFSSVELHITSVEMATMSLERAFAYFDPQDHDSKGYIHVGASSIDILFSAEGRPVLHRELDNNTSTVSERRRLDVKGAMQFVDRYAPGSPKYKSVCIGGEFADTVKPILEREQSGLTMEMWAPEKLYGMPKDTSVNTIIAIGAALRNKIPSVFNIDISGLTRKNIMEKLMMIYCLSVSGFIAAIFLLISFAAQINIFMKEKKINSLNSRTADVSFMYDMSESEINDRLNSIRGAVEDLMAAFRTQDEVAPKMSAIVGVKDERLWLTSVMYENMFPWDVKTDVNSKDWGVKMSFVGETMNQAGGTPVKIIEKFKKDIAEQKEFQNFDVTLPLFSSQQNDASLSENVKFSIDCLRRK